MNATPATWLFHPYLGMNIITPLDEINQPLFDRGTILNLSDAEAFGRQFPFAEDAEKLKHYTFMVPVLGATGHDTTAPARDQASVSPVPEALAALPQQAPVQQSQFFAWTKNEPEPPAGRESPAPEQATPTPLPEDPQQPSNPTSTGTPDAPDAADQPALAPQSQFFSWTRDEPEPPADRDDPAPEGPEYEEEE